MEKHEYEDDTIPQHIASHYRQIAHDRALRMLDIAYEKSKRMDDDEMRQVEPWQVFPWYAFLR